MGGMFSNCFKGNNNQREDPPPKPNNTNHYKEPAKSRVNETDKAILDVKARLKKLKMYIDKLEIQTVQQKEKIQEHLKDKNKQRALIALKHKKFLEKQVDKAFGAQTLLQQTIQNIESAQVDVQVFEALKTGDKVISELQEKASLENFEELFEKHQEHLEKQKMEQEYFGQVLNEEDLEDELAALDAMILEEEIPNAASGELQESGQQERVHNRQQEDQQQQQQQQKKVPSKQQPLLA